MGLFAYLFGKSSEEAAAKWLSQNGFKVLERNFRSRFGEIDIIALDGFGVLHFIEVKASKGGYEAKYRLSPAKLSKLLKAVDFYMLKNSPNQPHQLDLLAINGEQFELVENITL